MEVLWKHQALLHVVAINVGLEDADGVRQHRRIQAEKMMANLTSEHHAELVKQVEKLRASLEAMSDQLYI